MALRAVLFWGVVVTFGGAACGASTADVPRELARAGGECHGCAGEPASAGMPLNSGGGDGGGGAEPSGPGGAGMGEPRGGASDSEAGAAGAAGAAVALPDIAVRALTISQTVEIPLMEAGNELGAGSRVAPLVAGKRAVVRALVETLPLFRARPLLGVLDIETGENTRSVVSERTIVASSTQDELSSSFVFQVAAEDLTPDSAYRLRVLESDTTPLARFPEQGSAPFGARSLPPFELVLVPFVVGGFAPKTGEVELEALRRRLLALFPSTGVDITRAAPVTLDYVVDADGAGWDAALDEIYELRANANPAHDVFYFGVLAPGRSYDAFCPNGCTVGYSVVADAADTESRGSIGIGVFPDGSGVEDAWDTLLHELGHALGREHAPCPAPPDPDQPDGIDRRWPSDTLHRGAALGAYGYDFELGRLIEPRRAKDIMSYCTPAWISDYTYAGIFKRLDYIQNERVRVLSSAPAELFRVARINRDGRASWLGDRYRQGRASPRSVELLDANGDSLGQLQAQVASLDHARGGYVWLAASELRTSGAVSVDLRPLGGPVLGL